MIAEVVLSDQVFTALAAGVTLIILGLFGWVLTKAVQLGEVVSKLEEQSSDHDRRIGRLEAASHARR